ncbi:lanthionine synthetase C family protein [Pontimicrobium sp. MEBiC06410]
MTKKIIETKLKEIDEIIKKEYRNENNIGVISGLSGMALFQFYYSKYLDTPDNANFGVTILGDIIEKINGGYNSSLFSNGIAGFGWFLDFLELNEFIDVESDGILEELDDYLLTAMNTNLKQKNYDLLYGAIGQACYFFNRYKNTKSNSLKEKYTEILLEFITSLKKISEKEDDKIKWSSFLTYIPRKEGYGICLAHGVSSIISMLSKLHKEVVFKDKVTPLLKGSINYVLSFKSTDPNSLSCFPIWVLPNGEPEGPSRIAWCYGDLGIGAALLQASKALNDDDLNKESLRILKHTTRRRTPEKTMVADAGICHGSFGNALIYNRIYKETGEEIFKETSEFWIKNGVEMGHFTDGYAGYKMWDPDEKEWSKSTSFLTGITGIGLAMIAHLGNFDSNWDECLMIS